MDFIKLTHQFNGEYFYINVDSIETIHLAYSGSQVVSVNTSADEVGYAVIEKPDEIMKMIKEIRR